MTNSCRTMMVIGAALVLVNGCQKGTEKGGATVFGITFEAITNIPGAAQLAGEVSSVEDKSAKVKIRDVQFDLTKVNDGNSYTLSFDGKSYGTVQSGDKVAINESRKSRLTGNRGRLINEAADRRRTTRCT